MDAAAPGPGADAALLVQTAVEEFIDRHTAGEAPDLREFTSRYPEALRPRILHQCREFLAFDGFVGRQEWTPEALATPAGRTFGDFVIKEELGRGGMGIVYLAQQRSLNRRVALKVMQSGLTLSKRHVERFRREAAAAAQLRHPGIVAVHSFAEVDGTFAIAMDYVAGRNLADVLDDLRLRRAGELGAVEGSLGLRSGKGYTAECALLGAQLAAALHAAHQAGIAHRDLKPRNVMIDEGGQARLLDFGLAKSLEGESLSVSGEITGTAHYMSPEQTLAKRVALDHRTDVFSLGVILYELLTLQRPFEGKNLQQVVYAICFTEPVPIHKRNPKVPRDLVTVCMKALEKDPQARYQTAAEFEQDLQRFLRFEPVHARPAGPGLRTLRWVQRHRTESLAAGLLLLLGIGSLGYGAWRARDDERAAGDLIAAAEQDAARADFAAAIQKATEALLRRDSAVVRAQLKAYQAQKESQASQKERNRAESARLATESLRRLQDDRETGLLLALAAVDADDSAESRSAVLRALGSGFVTHALTGHRVLYQARLSPDGRFVATTGKDDPVVQLWDTATGVRLGEVQGHREWVVDVAFQPGGDLLATASVDGSARLWQLQPGGTDDHRTLAVREVQSLLHDGAAVGSVQFDQRGRRLLTTASRCPTKGFRAVVWQVGSPQPVAELGPHAWSVEAAALSPDGSLAATFGDPGTVRLWRTDDGQELQKLTGHRGQVAALAFRADGALLATADGDGTVRVFGLPDGTLRRTVRHAQAVRSVAFGPGDLLLTASQDRTARLWNLDLQGQDAREVRAFTGHTQAVAAAALDAKGQFVVTAGEDRRALVFDAGTGAELARLEVGYPLRAVAFAPEARCVLATPAGPQALLWEVANTAGTVTLRHPGFVHWAGFADQERVVTVADPGSAEDGGVRVWNARTGQQLAGIDRRGDAVLTADLDGRGERLVVGTDKGAVAVHTLWDGKELFALAGHGGRKVVAVAFAAGGERILSAGQDGAACVWNANDRRLAGKVQRPVPLAAAALSPDGTLLATVDEGAGKALLWRLDAATATATAAGELAGHQKEITAVVFAPDGTVVTTSLDATGRRHRQDGTLLREYACDRPLRRAAFARDGSRLLLCGSASSGNAADSVVWLRDAATGADLLKFTGHQSLLTWAAFSPDGSFAITGSRDRTARIWPTDPVAVANRLKTRSLKPEERRDYGLPPLPR